MTRKSPKPSRADPARPAQPAPQPLFAFGWHLAWALGLIAGGAGLWLARGVSGFGPLAGVGALAAAAVLGLIAAAAGMAWAEAAAVSAWGLAGLAAMIATGGSAGPFAALALTPLAAGVAFRRRSIMSLGVAVSVIVAALAGVAAATFDLPTLREGEAVWLGLAALLAATVSLGAGLVDIQGRARGQIRRHERASKDLSDALSQQPQLFLSLRPNGRIRAALGRAPKGVLATPGADFVDLAAPDDGPVLQDALSEAITNGEAQAGFRPAGEPDGWCEASLRRVNAERLAVALHDASRQRGRELALMAARDAAENRSVGKTRFLANMSHELRTPLNAILGFSDIMRQRLFGPLSDRYADYADLIHESGSHLLELINDVLDLSKIEAEKFELAREDFDAREAVQSVVRLMQGQADRGGVTLKLVVPNAPLDAEADRRAIKQITLNLVSNAIKFTPRGGSVSVALQGNGDTLELTVVDTGVGIAPDDLERLGRPFEQAGGAAQKAVGAGLGLSLARAFARLHGGELVLRSKVGAGTVATVRLPVLTPPVRTAAE